MSGSSQKVPKVSIYPGGPEARVLIPGEQDLIIIDIETTGLNPPKDQILEVAAVRVTPKLQTSVLLDSLVRLENWNVLCEEWWPVQEGYISEDEIEQAPPPEYVAHQLRSVIDTSYWTSYRLKFERDFLRQPPWQLTAPR